MRFSKVFVTPSPSFYKNKLFSEVAKRLDICVIYTGAAYHERNADFYKGDRNFDIVQLSKGKINQIKEVNSFLRNNDFDEIIYGGWDNLITWYTIFRTSKNKNSCIFESSINESDTSGYKGIIKKIFLSKLKKAYPSGILQTDLLKALGFSGEIVQSGGCGILNYQSQPIYEKRASVKRFLFVGRLVPVKNLELLINIFNTMPELSLQIIGFGPLEKDLKSKAKNNISFVGSVDNVELPRFYKEADVFIIPSYSETWGLVVEEALNNGTPVIVSDHVGCYKDLVNDNTGLVFKSNNAVSLAACINQICNVEYYNKLRAGVAQLDFYKRAQRQINSFL